MKDKYMKRITTVVMVVLIIFSLGSCSRMHNNIDNPNSSNNSANNQINNTSDSPPLNPSHNGDGSNDNNNSVEDELNITRKLASILEQAIAINNDYIKWNNYIGGIMGCVAVAPWLVAAVRAVTRTSITPFTAANIEEMHDVCSRCLDFGLEAPCHSEISSFLSNSFLAQNKEALFGIIATGGWIYMLPICTGAAITGAVTYAVYHWRYPQSLAASKNAYVTLNEKKKCCAYVLDKYEAIKAGDDNVMGTEALLKGTRALLEGLFSNMLHSLKQLNLLGDKKILDSLNTLKEELQKRTIAPEGTTKNLVLERCLVVLQYYLEDTSTQEKESSV